MERFVAPVIAALLVAGMVGFLIRWRRAASKAKQDKEQIERKLKEDALDRALSNGPRSKIEVQSPVEIHYTSGSSQKERGSMLRLTEQAETVSKEYLFQQSATIYIGEEYGRSAVFQKQGKGTLYCELFPHQDATYVRLCGRGECRLIRKKQTAPVTSKAIRLRSGDKIETQTGVFLVEFI